MILTLNVAASPLRGSVPIEAIAVPQGAETVTKVELFVDTMLVATGPSSPLQFTWDTTAVDDGTHEIRARVSYNRRQILDTKRSVLIQNIPDIAPLAPAQLPPALVTAPLISGLAKVGEVLFVSTGVWLNSPTEFTYQWLLCDSSGDNPTTLDAASAASYQPVADEVGSTLRCRVIAYNSQGASASVLVAQSAVVASLAAAVPVNTVLPIVSGTPTQGQSLSVSNGAWTNSPTSYTYQWERCNSAGIACEDIASANSNTYALVTADVNQTLRCEVIAVNGSGAGTGARSLISPVVMAVPPPPPPPPPPPFPASPLETYRVTIPQGGTAGWLTFDSPTSIVVSPGTARDKHRVIRWGSGGLYAAKRMYAIHGFRLITGVPGRMYDYHTQPNDVGGWNPPGSNFVAPLAIDYPPTTDSGTKLVLAVQPEQNHGNAWTFEIFTQAQIEARRGQWVWLWLEVDWGRRDLANKGAVKVWVAGEDTPRVSLSGISTHWSGENQITFWEGGYMSNGHSGVVHEIVATRFGRTPKEAFEDIPHLWGFDPGPTGSYSQVSSRLSNEVAIPTALRW